MKRIAVIVLCLSVMLSASVAETSSAGNAVYTNVPGMSSQADMLGFDLSLDGADFSAMKPTDDSDAELRRIIGFTAWTETPVARYFPEDTQRGINDLVGDSDSLIMSDYMRTNFISPEKDVAKHEIVHVVAKFSLDYLQGQTVVIVVGVNGDNGELEWVPVEAEVVETGKIAFDLEPEVQEKINGRESLFTVLTRNGDGEMKAKRQMRDEAGSSKVVNDEETVSPVGESDDNTIPEPAQMPYVRPSKRVSDMTGVVPASENKNSASGVQRSDGETSAESAKPSRELGDGASVSDDKTGPVSVNITSYTTDALRAEENRAFAYIAGNIEFSDLPETSQRGIIPLMQSRDDMYGKKIYEVVKLEADGFDDTTGDVLTNIRFATPYTERQDIIVMIGCLDGDGNEVEWYELRSKVIDTGKLEIVFSENCMKSMQKYRTSLMLVFSPEIQTSDDDWEIVEGDDL